MSYSSKFFSPLNTLISTALPWLFRVSGIHRKRNYGFTRPTRPITAHERTAICKSQLEATIENPGNTRGGGGGGGGGGWGGGGVTSFWSLVRTRTIPGFSSAATQARKRAAYLSKCLPHLGLKCVNNIGMLSVQDLFFQLIGWLRVRSGVSPVGMVYFMGWAICASLTT